MPLHLEKKSIQVVSVWNHCTMGDLKLLFTLPQVFYLIHCTGLSQCWRFWWRSRQSSRCISGPGVGSSGSCASGWSSGRRRLSRCTGPGSVWSCPTRCSFLATTWRGQTSPWQCLEGKGLLLDLDFVIYYFKVKILQLRNRSMLKNIHYSFAKSKNFLL